MDKQTMEYFSEKVREYNNLESTKLFLADMKERLNNNKVRLISPGGYYLFDINEGECNSNYDQQTQINLAKELKTAMTEIIDANIENLDKRMEKI